MRKLLRIHIGLWVAIILTVIFLYPTLQNDLLYWDDYVYVTDNDLIRDLSTRGVAEMFKTSGVLSHYHPITLLSLSIDYQIGELNPFVYHTHNLLLHIVNLILVYVLFLFLSKKRLIAAIVTLLFCLHPMHIESVAWVSARKDLVYSVFFLLSMILYQKRQMVDSYKSSYYLGCLFFFIISLLSKGMAVSLPVVLLGMDYLAIRTDYKRMFLEKIPFFLLAFLFIYLGINGQNEGGALNSNAEIPFVKRPFIACYGLVMYCMKAFVPINQSGFYPYPSISGLPWYIYGSSVPVIGTIVYVLRQWKEKRVLVFGSFLFMISIFPVSQIIPFGHSIMADRYTYLPYLGLFFIIGFYFEKLIKEKEEFLIYRRSLFFILGAYILLLGGLSLNRSKVWKNDNTLWTDVSENYPNSYFAFGNLGDYWFNKGNNDKALAFYNKTIELEDRYFMAYNNRGLIYQKRGELDKALLDFDKAIQLKKYPKSFLNKGVLLFQEGSYIKAIKVFKKAVELDKGYALAWFNLGNSYYKIGELKLALNSFTHAEESGYMHPYLYLLFADIYSSQEMNSKALVKLEKCLQLYPNNRDGLIELGKFYVKSGEMKKAIPYLNKTINFYPDGKGGEAFYIRSIIYKELGELKLSTSDSIKARKIGFGITKPL